MDLLAHLFGAPAAEPSVTDLAAWRAHLAACPFSDPVDRAAWGGFEADRLGYAFVAGYAAALSALFARNTRGTSLKPLGALACLAATEEGGGHPRAIATRLDKVGGELFVRGTKTFATLATVADDLLVVASRGVDANGKNRLRVVRVPPTAHGVTLTPRPELPFAPEVPHAIAAFQSVVVRDEDVLPGDGYDAWLKPFRTLEDIHVLAAVLGLVARATRAFALPGPLVDGAASHLLSLRQLGARDPSRPETHLALAGTFDAVDALLERHAPDLSNARHPWSARWERDLPLLRVASGVRAKRRDAARARSGEVSSSP